MTDQADLIARLRGQMEGPGPAQTILNLYADKDALLAEVRAWRAVDDPQIRSRWPVKELDEARRLRAENEARGLK